jgi:hypothetical protein
MKNSRIIKPLLAGLILVLLSSYNAFAQEANFSGTWTINKEKVDFNGAPQWILPIKFVISQNADKINIQRMLLDNHSVENNSTVSLDFKGDSVQAKTSSGLPFKCLVSWNADQESFMFSSQSFTADGHPGSKVSENWFLSDDGDTLNINRSVEQADGFKYSIRAVYDKAN